MTHPVASPAKPRPRTLARVAAVQALYQAEQAAQSPETVIDQFIRHRLGPTGEDSAAADNGQLAAHIPLFAHIVRTATIQQDTLDTLITNALPDTWPLDRLDPVLRALLRAAGAELFLADGPPAKVVINEYLDVAHSFFSGEEPRLANGVLDRIAHHLRPTEFLPAT